MSERIGDFYSNERFDRTDYYDLLGVKPDSSEDVIKSAHKKLAMKLHPDAGGDEAAFGEVQEAFDVLSDADRKMRYDHYLQQNTGKRHATEKKYNTESEAPRAESVTFNERVPIVVDAKSQELLKIWGLAIVHDSLYQGTHQVADFYSRGENEKIEFTCFNSSAIKVKITEKDGRVIVYALSNGIYDWSSRTVQESSAGNKYEGRNNEFAVTVDSKARYVFAKFGIRVSDNILHMDLDPEHDINFRGAGIAKIDFFGIDATSLYLYVYHVSGKRITYVISSGVISVPPTE